MRPVGDQLDGATNLMCHACHALGFIVAVTGGIPSVPGSPIVFRDIGKYSSGE